VAYTLYVEANIPQAALSPDAGLYLSGRRIAALSPGAVVLTASIPPVRSDQITLEVRCRGWIPRLNVKGSQDDRTLGISLYSVTVRAKGATAAICNANTGP
jgi:hypothetical protein